MGRGVGADHDTMGAICIEEVKSIVAQRRQSLISTTRFVQFGASSSLLVPYQNSLLSLELLYIKFIWTSSLSSLFLAFIFNWETKARFLLHPQSRKAARCWVLRARFMPRQSLSCQSSLLYESADITLKI